MKAIGEGSGIVIAASRALLGVEWIVHAVSCAKPNLKLRRVLERRGLGSSKWQESAKLTILGSERES
jgi:hypothetical protein